MAKGTYYTKHFDETLRMGIYDTQVPNIDFLYKVSSTKDPIYNIGDRVCLPDGRVFRYCLAVTDTTWEAGRGVKFGGTMASDGIALCSPASAEAVGATSFTVATQTFTEDELRGGYCVLYTASNSYQQFGIIGNTAASASTVTIYLDHPLTVALGATNGIEVLPNPYRYIEYNTNAAYQSHAGVTISIPSTGKYFWIQTWGIMWINPGVDGMGGASGERTVVFWADGSLRTATTGNDNNQRAGFLVTKDASGTDSPPFVMLQVSP